MIFEEVTYNILLRGKCNLGKLQQTIKNHRAIHGGWLKDEFGAHGLFIYWLETEVGIAEINVFAFDSPGYAEQILLKIAIATPSEFINTVIEFIDELAARFIFSMSVYEIRMLEAYKFGSWNEIEDYIRLRHDYQEIHNLWRDITGMPACKTNEKLFAHNCIMAQVRQKKRLVVIAVCPRDGEVGFSKLGGFPTFNVVGTQIKKKDFYRQIETIQLEKGRLSGIVQKIKTIPPSPNDLVPGSEFPIEVIQISIDKTRFELELHGRAEERVGWIDCEIEYGTAALVIEQQLKCLIELATKLDWMMIGGFDFQKSTPADLDIRKLIEFISVSPKQPNK